MQTERQKRLFYAFLVITLLFTIHLHNVLLILTQFLQSNTRQDAILLEATSRRTRRQNRKRKLPVEWKSVQCVSLFSCHSLVVC